MQRLASLFYPALTPHLVALSKHLDALHQLHGVFYVVAKSPYLVHGDGSLCMKMVEDPCIIIDDLDDYPCELQFELALIASCIPKECYSTEQLRQLDEWARMSIGIVDLSFQTRDMYESERLRMCNRLN